MSYAFALLNRVIVLAILYVDYHTYNVFLINNSISDIKINYHSVRSPENIFQPPLINL